MKTKRSRPKATHEDFQTFTPDHQLNALLAEDALECVDGGTEEVLKSLCRGAEQCGHDSILQLDHAIFFGLLDVASEVDDVGMAAGTTGWETLVLVDERHLARIATA